MIGLTPRVECLWRAFALPSAWLLLACGSLAGCSTDRPESATVGRRSSALAFSQLAKLAPTGAAAGDEIGIAVAVSGSTAVLGAFLDDTKGIDAGAAYVFVRTTSGWTQQAKLTASDGSAGDQFGRGVAIDRDTIIVGASQHDGGGVDAGAAYVFTRSGSSWTQRAKLVASDADDGDRFGWSVGIDATTVVIGAYGKGPNKAKAETGAAYVFNSSGSSWTQQAKLTASDADAGDRFGWSVDVDGDSAAVGAYFEDARGTSSGSVYVFARNGTSWTQQSKLTASDGAAGDRLGFGVALDGNTVVAGAYRDDIGSSSDVGSAYVFARNGASWTQQAKLAAAGGQPLDYIGFSVAVDGDTALVGALFDDRRARNAGAVYVFARSGTSWSEQQRLTATDGASVDWFGYSVGVSGSNAVVGAARDDDQGATDRGSAYAFVSAVGGGDAGVDSTPAVPDSAPAVPDSAPAVPDSAPAVPDSAPAVPDSAPAVPDSAPAVPDSAPVVPDSAPVVPDSAPVVPDSGPVVPDSAPVLLDSAPVVPDSAPAVPDIAPAVVDSAPAVPDIAPDKDSSGGDGASPSDAGGGADSGGGGAADSAVASDAAASAAMDGGATTGESGGCDCGVGATPPPLGGIFLLATWLLVRRTRRRRTGSSPGPGVA